MLAKIKKIAAEWGSHFTFVDYVSGIGVWIWGLISTAILAGLSAVTPWLESAGPFGWFLLGLAGTMLLAWTSVQASAWAVRARANWRALRSNAASAVLPLPRSDEGAAASPTSAPTEPVAPENEEDRQKKHALIEFVFDAAVPAVTLQWRLHSQILGVICHNASLQHLAGMGLQHPDYGAALYNGTIAIDRKIRGSEASSITLPEIILYTRMFIEKYPLYVSLGKRLLDGEQSEAVNHRHIQQALSAWHSAHHRLVDAYDSIRKDVRFPDLYRPAANPLASAGDLAKHIHQSAND